IRSGPSHPAFAAPQPAAVPASARREAVGSSGAVGADSTGGTCACLRRELSGEPDAGNLHLRFDEGRVGRGLAVALSPTLPARQAVTEPRPLGSGGQRAFFSIVLNMATLLFAPQTLAYARGSVRRRFGAANVRERMRNYLLLAAGKGGGPGGGGALAVGRRGREF